MAGTDQIDVERVDPSASTERPLAEELATLINEVYDVAEAGLWLDGASRTDAALVAEMIAAGELAVARRGDGPIVGCVRVHDVAADTSELGILVTAPEVRGTGVGRALLDFVERDAPARGLRALQLELLVPRYGTHPEKERLKELYGRRGFRLTHAKSMDGSYPELAPFLATPCDLEIHRKDLT